MGEGSIPSPPHRQHEGLPDRPGPRVGAEETSGTRLSTGGTCVNVSTLEWSITVGVTIAIILFDVFVVARKPHEPSTKECVTYLSIYVGLAIAFGIWTFSYHGSQYGVEFFAGWLTEYSLSIDNLFIFISIMASVNVPRKYQQEALLVGIIIALVFRAIFIAVGAVAINNVSWVFYLFGAFLIYTAWNLIR